jgi:hypothetical protein
LHTLIYNGRTSYLAIGKANLRTDSNQVKPRRQDFPMNGVETEAASTPGASPWGAWYLMHTGIAAQSRQKNKQEILCHD